MRQALAIESTESSSKARVLAIPPDGVERVEHLVEPLLTKATARTPKIDAADFLRQCRQSAMQLWVILDDVDVMAAMVTQLTDWDAGWRACQVICLGGHSMARWSDVAIRELEAYAVAEDCDALELVGRPGWGRIFPDFVEVERVYSKGVRS